MVQVIEQGDIFGKIGQGFGKGLGEQIPKEVAHQRLSSGLKKLSETEGLTPRQFWAQANSIYGISPEQQRQAGEFARLEARANAMKPLGQQETKPNPFANMPKRIEGPNVSEKAPSLTEPESFEQSQLGYIPPTQEEIFQKASEEFEKNPAKFGNDPQSAIDYAREGAQQEEKINQAYQKKHEKLTNIQDNIVERLRNHSKGLNVEVPENMYSKIENEAIQATKPKSMGGRGLTEQQSMKEYGKKLDDISRNYKALQPLLTGWSFTGRTSKDTLSSLSAIQQKFKEFDDTENLADELITKGNHSPIRAHSMADPVYQYPDINRYIKDLPEPRGDKYGDIQRDTMKMAPKLAELIKKTGASPLAVADELKRKNYDSKEFLRYLTENRDKYKLTEKQGRELDKPRNYFGTFNDWWFDSFSGLK